jgi:hypothetical protein
MTVQICSAYAKKSLFIRWKGQRNQSKRGKKFESNDSGRSLHECYCLPRKPCTLFAISIISPFSVFHKEHSFPKWIS